MGYFAHVMSLMSSPVVFSLHGTEDWARVNDDSRVFRSIDWRLPSQTENFKGPRVGAPSGVKLVDSHMVSNRPRRQKGGLPFF